MKRSPNPVLVVALLVSILIHLFLVDRAVELTLRWQLFSTSAADEFFRLGDRVVPPIPEFPPGRTEWRPEEIISIGAKKDEVVRTQEKTDEKLLLESQKFISSGVTEEELLKAIEKAIAAEEVAKGEETTPGPVAEPTIPQEVLAIETEGVPPPGRVWINAKVKRGTATSDFVFFSETGAFTEPVPSGIGKGKTGEVSPTTAPGERKGIARVAMAEEAKGIPGVITLPPPATERVIESPELVDIVSDDYGKIRKYPPLDDLLTVRLFTYHRPGEAKGYFKLAVEPRRDKGEFIAIPKDITFVIDSSWSITQQKLNSYAQGLKLCLKAFNPNDRFNVVEFKEFIRKLNEEDAVPVTPEMVGKAEALLSGLVSEGATAVYSSLTQLVTSKPSAGRPRIIFLVTDGRPTTGIRQNREIINEVTRLNNLNLKASIFAFAGGETINTPLLDLLSYRNRGAGRFEPNDRKIPESLSEFYRGFNSPIFLNPRFNFGSLDSAEVYPKVLPDLYLNGKLELFGRFGKEEEFSMQLLGEADGQTKEYVLQQKLTGRDNGDETIARMWAFRKIYYLVGEMVEKGGSEGILSEIEKLSADYKVETSYYRAGGGRS